VLLSSVEPPPLATLANVSSKFDKLAGFLAVFVAVVLPPFAFAWAFNSSFKRLAA